MSKSSDELHAGIRADLLKALYDHSSQHPGGTAFLMDDGSDPDFAVKLQMARDLQERGWIEGRIGPDSMSVRVTAAGRDEVEHPDSVEQRVPRRAHSHIGFSDDEVAFMRDAIAEARLSRHEPDRSDRAQLHVGAVLVKDGRVIARGHRGEHSYGDHAEYTMLRKNLKSPADAANGTVFCTLEPCIKRGPGKTPCAKWLTSLRVARVVIGVVDPNRDIRGGGIKMLRDGGIDVQLFPRELASELEALNVDFEREHQDQTAGASEAKQRVPDWYKELRGPARSLHALTERVERAGALHLVSAAYRNFGEKEILLQGQFADQEMRRELAAMDRWGSDTLADLALDAGTPQEIEVRLLRLYRWIEALADLHGHMRSTLVAGLPGNEDGRRLLDASASQMKKQFERIEDITGRASDRGEQCPKFSLQLG